MRLIADSGATKTDWCLGKNKTEAQVIQTQGINPFHQSAEYIKHIVTDELLPQLPKDITIRDIHFYGAGCTPEKSVILKDILATHFPESTIEVQSDLVGAARALCGNAPGIACILGTGANSCLWSGKEIEKNVPALGFILGDEGSGAVLGKRLVADLLKNQLSDELKEKFLAQYNITAADIIENVYRKPFPNRYLASLSKFCSENMDNPLIAQLVYDHFDYFAKRILPQYPALPVGFIGSIAYYYQDVLKRVLVDNGFQVGKILQGPMEGLKEYHKKDIVPTM